MVTRERGLWRRGTRTVEAVELPKTPACDEFSFMLNHPNKSSLEPLRVRLFGLQQGSVVQDKVRPEIDLSNFRLAVCSWRFSLIGSSQRNKTKTM